MEFHFALFLFMKHIKFPEKTVPAWVRRAVSQNPELTGECERYWRTRSLAGVDMFGAEWGELLVAGWHEGVLTAPDIEDFIANLEHSFEVDYALPALPSEPEETQTTIHRRVLALRNDAAQRRDYVALVQRLWALVRPAWLAEGRDGATRAVTGFAAKLGPTTDLRQLIPENTFVHKDLYQEQIANARAAGELVIIPLGLAGAGQLYWSLPGIVIVGVGLELAEREALRRERSARAAQRLKVLSDPTRVTILKELLRGWMEGPTVTELAGQFGLSQPTVSVHMKQLRKAGLAIPERTGTEVRYKATAAAVQAYMHDTLDDILEGVVGADSCTYAPSPTAAPQEFAAAR